MVSQKNGSPTNATLNHLVGRRIRQTLDLTRGIPKKQLSELGTAKDVRAFNNLRTGLFDAIGPVGALEELLVDHMIMFQWRNLRVLRFEVASIRNQSDTAIEVWESEQAVGSLSRNLG